MPASLDEVHVLNILIYLEYSQPHLAFFSSVHLFILPVPDMHYLALGRSLFNFLNVWLQNYLILQGNMLTTASNMIIDSHVFFLLQYDIRFHHIVTIMILLMC